MASYFRAETAEDDLLEEDYRRRFNAFIQDGREEIPSPAESLEAHWGNDKDFGNVDYCYMQHQADLHEEAMEKEKALIPDPPGFKYDPNDEQDELDELVPYEHYPVTPAMIRFKSAEDLKYLDEEHMRQQYMSRLGVRRINAIRYFFYLKEVYSIIPVYEPPTANEAQVAQF